MMRLGNTKGFSLLGISEFCIIDSLYCLFLLMFYFIILLLFRMYSCVYVVTSHILFLCPNY